MKNSILTLFYIIFLITATVNCSEYSVQVMSSEFYVASWNLENLFDTIDDTDKIDEWFLPTSEINWTNEKLDAKLENLAKVISYLNDGNGPDILGVQEVEHEELIKQLISKINLDKNYKVIYRESPDKRGIDNALIYDSNLFEVDEIESLNIDLGEDKSTRDILFCSLKYGKEELKIFVNHWPSRREGLKKSEPNRVKAAESLMNKIKSFENPQNSNIIILGDFNDLPSNISIKHIIGTKEIQCGQKSEDAELSFFNITEKSFKEGNGTYKYDGHWNMLDQIIISSSFLNKSGLDYKCDSFEIIKPDFLIQKDGKYKGTSLPTFGGKKYLGGFSDHFPIGSKFFLIK